MMKSRLNERTAAVNLVGGTDSNKLVIAGLRFPIMIFNKGGPVQPAAGAETIHLSRGRNRNGTVTNSGFPGLMATR